MVSLVAIKALAEPAVDDGSKDTDKLISPINENKWVISTTPPQVDKKTRDKVSLVSVYYRYNRIDSCYTATSDTKISTFINHVSTQNTTYIESLMVTLPKDQSGKKLVNDIQVRASYMIGTLEELCNRSDIDYPIGFREITLYERIVGKLCCYY